MIPSLKDKGVTVVSLAPPLAHAHQKDQHFSVKENESDSHDESGLSLSYGLNLSSMESSPQESDNGNEQKPDHPSQSLTDIIPSTEVNFGSIEELRSLQKRYVYARFIRMMMFHLLV